MRKAWTKEAGNMRTIRLSLALGGLAAVALIFLVRTAVGQVSLSFDANSVRGAYAFRMVPVKSFSSDNASSSGLATAPRQDILRVGVFTATPDAGFSPTHGTLTLGKTIATTDTNTGSTRVIVFTWTGEYKVNSDGTGVFTVNDPPLTAQTCYDSTAAILFVAPIGPAPGPPPPPLLGVAGACPTDDEGAETYAFVIKGQGSIQFIETDNSGGGAKIFLTGEATRRFEGE